MADYGRIVEVSGSTDVPGEADDTGQTVLGGGGQIASRSPEDLDPLAGAAPVTVESWPPADWGPKLYQFEPGTDRRTAVSLDEL